MDGRRKSKPNNRDLKQLRRQRQGKQNQKYEFASFQTLSRLFGTALFVKVGLFSWSWILKGYIHVQVLHKTSNGKVSRRSRAVDVKEMYLKFESFTSSKGNEEICFYNLRGYDKRYNEILVSILIFHNILFVLIFHKTKKHKLRAQHGALKLSLENCISFALVTLWHNCY